ncbi:MAG TPA: ATP-binding protein [Anaeromyxobacteraceae bacterium]|nr:ATP-binding protein [Anaeromyxobacteraceae bacterium]
MPLVAFVTVALGLLASAGLLHRWMRQGAHEHAGAELDAVAAVKVAAINAWRAEHVGAAAYAATYPSVARAAAASARGKLDPGLVAHVHEVLEHLAERRGFLRIALLAPDGRPVVEWVGPGDPGVPFGPELLRASTGSPEGTSWVLASAPGRRRPVLDAAAAVPVEGSATLAVALRVAMGPFFDDVIQKWPVPSPSGTTGLVRRDGDQVVVCASGDGAGAAPPPALLPLADSRLPAVQAALGRTGVVQGVDVRGTPVLAAIRPVPGTDWKLVTRKDVSEAEAPMQAPFTAIASLVALLLAAAGVMLLLWWRGERAREAMQAQLERAERLASLGTLAAGVAHEINNPLAYVLTNLEFALSRLAESGAPKEDLEALAEARDGAARVRDVVRGLRAFSRPGAGRRGPADAGAELQTALRLASNDIRRRARLETSLQPVPRVVSGEHELGQVFLNLLLNAAQAIPEGHAGENVVRVESGTDAAGWARIVVQDSGVGIPPEVQRRIFEPFFTTKPLGTGTGLGLAIAHSVVVAAGGRIEVESEVGKGATFRVLLPPAPVQAAEPETAPITGPGPAGEAG